MSPAANAENLLGPVRISDSKNLHQRRHVCSDNLIGCGQHIESALAGLSKDQICTCPRTGPSAPSTGAIFAFFIVAALIWYLIGGR